MSSAERHYCSVAPTGALCAASWTLRATAVVFAANRSPDHCNMSLKQSAAKANCALGHSATSILQHRGEGEPNLSLLLSQFSPYPSPFHSVSPFRLPLAQGHTKRTSDHASKYANNRRNQAIEPRIPKPPFHQTQVVAELRLPRRDARGEYSSPLPPSSCPVSPPAAPCPRLPLLLLCVPGLCTLSVCKPGC